ncbi:hypothetical protein GCM10025738_03540 [Microbacterium fluvii]
MKQNASQVVASAAAGEHIVITDRGRPVALLSPLPSSPLERLRTSGRARAARRTIADLPPAVEGAALSGELDAMRDAERY